MKRLGDHPPLFVDEPGPGRVVGGGPEAIGARGVEEGAEEIGRGERQTVARRDLDLAGAGDDGPRAVGEGRQLEAATDRLGTVVDDMDVETVDTLVGEDHHDRARGAGERVETRLGHTGRVDVAPAGAVPGIAMQQDQGAARRRVGDAKRPQGLLHHVSGGGTRDLEGPDGIVVPRSERIDAEDLAFVMPAHVLEIPGGAGISRHACLPARGMDGRNRQVPRQSGRVGDMREGETLGGEADLREAGVGEGAQIGSDAEIMPDAVTDREGHRPTVRRRAQPRHAGQGPARDLRKDLVEERMSPFRRRQAHHGGLLGDLRTAAEERRRRRGGEAFRDLLGLATAEIDEGGIGVGVVEVGEHQILPDQQTEFVAEFVKHGALVGADTGDADHVRTGLGETAQIGLEARPVARQADHVRRRPYDAAGEDVDPVDAETEVPAIGPAIDLDAAEAGTAERNDFGAEHQIDVVEGGRAVGRREPRGDTGEMETRERGAVRLERQAGGTSGATHLAAVERATGGGHEAHLEMAVDAVPLGAQTGVGDRARGGVDHQDRTERADHVDRRAPAGHVAEERGAHGAQALIGDEGRAPTRAPRPHRLQPRGERAEDDRQLPAGREVDLDIVGEEHALALEDLLAVEKDLGEGGEPLEAQDPAAGDGERRAPPPVAIMKGRRRVERPASARRERGGDGAGHKGGYGLEIGAEIHRLRDGARRGRDEGPTGVDRGRDLEGTCGHAGAPATHGVGGVRRE